MTFSFQLEKKISLKYFPCMYFQKIWYFGQSIFDFLSSGYFWFSGSEICKTKEKFSAKKAIYQKKLKLGFSSKIEVPQLGKSWLELQDH